MSWKVHDTDEVFAALRGLCSNSYRMYDPSEYRYYYDHECDAYECAVEDAAREYERLLEHCEKQRDELAGLKDPERKERIDRMKWALSREEEQAMEERTRTEYDGVGSSITDELRRHIYEWATAGEEMRLALAIADSIDEDYAKARDKAYNEGVCDGIDADKEARGYVKLPVDAHGEPIHVGDYVETLIEAFKGERGRVEYLALTEDGWEVDGEAPSTVRHYHAPTVEDVLREFFSRYVTTKPKDEDDTIIAEYAAKLRLAGEGE